MAADVDIGRHLLPGERVAWQGRPWTGLMLQARDAFLIPFSAVWGGGALYWNVGAWSTRAPIAFKLFGLPFLAAGAYITVGRFLVDMWARRRLHYVVTDRRILILRSGGTTTSKSLDIKRLPALALEERWDGSGTIRFGSPGTDGRGANFGAWSPAFDSTPQFLRIRDVRSVYELIQRAAA